MRITRTGILRAHPSQTSWLSPHPVTPYEVHDHSDDGDDQEQVNQSPYRVECKQTESPAHSEDNRHSQKHQDLPLRGSDLCRGIPRLLHTAGTAFAHGMAACCWE